MGRAACGQPLWSTPGGLALSGTPRARSVATEPQAAPLHSGAQHHSERTGLDQYGLPIGTQHTAEIGRPDAAGRADGFQTNAETH